MTSRSTSSIDSGWVASTWTSDSSTPDPSTPRPVAPKRRPETGPSSGELTAAASELQQEQQEPEELLGCAEPTGERPVEAIRRITDQASESHTARLDRTTRRPGGQAQHDERRDLLDPR